MRPRWAASRHMNASSAAAAPMVWPSPPLIEFTGTWRARAPSARLSAAVSMRSFSRVAVPWALTKSTSRGATSASASAARIARSSPRPSGSGAAMWKPSLALPYPSRVPRRGPRTSRSRTSRASAPASPSRRPVRRRSNGRTSSRVSERSALNPRSTKRQSVS